MTSPELSRHISSEVRKAKQKRKDVMGRFQLNVEGFSEDEENILRSQYAREDVTVSEDAMLELLGETAVAEAADESADPSDLAPILGDIEASLKGVHTAASRIEAHLGAGQNQ
jgi:small subunit ribosomal protein S2